MVSTIIYLHFNQHAKTIQKIKLGICNEVYNVHLDKQDVIIRLNACDKFLKGTRDHTPQLKALDINVPDLLFEDYSKTTIPLSYQIQNKIAGEDLGYVIDKLTDEQLKNLAKEIATIFQKTRTLPASNEFGVIWGGGENDVSRTWTERMKIWIDDCKQRGGKTGVMDKELFQIADNLFSKYKSYFELVRPTTYYGDISSKNVMIQHGVFSGLVDLDGLTQGDPLEAVGRIKLSWFGTHHGEVYTNAVMDELNLNKGERHLVTMYALLNAISWACDNGIQHNQNTQPIVNTEKMKHDKAIIKKLAMEV
jgi:aminoglycoside phosphotransferase (APT) family kinase protein